MSKSYLPVRYYFYFRSLRRRLALFRTRTLAGKLGQFKTWQHWRNKGRIGFNLMWNRQELGEDYEHVMGNGKKLCTMSVFCRVRAIYSAHCPHDQWAQCATIRSMKWTYTRTECASGANIVHTKCNDRYRSINTDWLTADCWVNI